MSKKNKSNINTNDIIEDEKNVKKVHKKNKSKSNNKCNSKNEHKSKSVHEKSTEYQNINRKEKKQKRVNEEQNGEVEEDNNSENCDIHDSVHRDENQEEQEQEVELNDIIKNRLKKKIISWMDYDDKIKQLNTKTKKYKDAKKQQEELIIDMINKLGIGSKKLAVNDENNNFRGDVYRYKSITKGAIKEDIIKDALMEAIRNEDKVNQLIKKIDSKRPINERYYLKRTNKNKDKK